MTSPGTPAVRRRGSVVEWAPAAALAVVLGLIAACSGVSDGTAAPTIPPTTTTVPATTTSAPPATVPEALAGFPLAEVVVSGTPWQVAIADTRDLQVQGLTGVTDLGALSGMLFVFEGDTGVGFWMKDTLIPLDIAFFRADGSLLEVISMVPCPGDDCPTYRASEPYRYALEASPGAFDGLEPLTLEVPVG